MSVEVCSQCHNTTFHFDATKHAIVCDVCGWEKNSSERAGEMLAYDQYRQKAIAFVKARDYASAKPFLEKMRNVKPDDADIYYLHLMGLTDCCTNLLLEPSDVQRYSQVREYWNVFCGLNGDKRIFLSYFNRRATLAKKISDEKFFSAAVIAAVIYIALLISLSLALSGNYAFIVFAVIIFFVIFKQKPLTKLIRIQRSRK